MNYFIVLLIVSLVASAVGWLYFIYFFSVGYGLSVAALSVTLALMFTGTLTLPTALMCLVLFIYGLRLGGFLLYRELKSAAYKKILYAPDIKQKKPLGVIVGVWLFCALLYVGQVAPVAVRLHNSQAGVSVSNLWAWIGVALMVLGTLLETVADAQKSRAKKRNPNRFVTTGLYKIVRCPNYLGEVVLWTGCFLSIIGTSASWWQWLIAAVGYAGIVYVMFSGTRRLELRQDTTYGSDPEFQEYIRRTPVLIPFVPLYSVKKYTWLQA